MNNIFTKVIVFSAAATVSICSGGCSRYLIAEVGKELIKDVVAGDASTETSAAATVLPESSATTTEPESTSEALSESESEMPEHSEPETSESSEPETSESSEPETKPEFSVQAPDYIIPDSSTRYVAEDELDRLSTYDLRLAKNEIFARHGRKFQSAELQDYFNSKSWYKGTIEPADFDDNVFNVYEKANIKLMNKREIVVGSDDLPTAPSKERIDQYGYDHGYSVLAFELHGNTAIDRGKYWEVNATYYQGIEAPGNLNLGDTVSLVFDELTGVRRTLEYRKEGLVEPGTPLGAYQYYYSPSADGSPVTLYQDSDDRVDKRIYEGKLYIRKDATTEIAIVNDVRPFTEEQFQADYLTYNGVYFDTKGYVTRLVYYGD